jgi:uncharacterized damage-inducible protein DinB
MIKRPEKNEYNEYYDRYISLVPKGDILQILDEQMKQTVSLLKDVSEEKGLFRYAPEKWSLKEVLGHLADTERIMAYRILTIARGGKIPLPGYDIDGYVSNASFNRERVEDLLDHFSVVREATIQLLKSIDEEKGELRGVANNFEVTVRALVYIIAGHELHHRQILQDRYLGV